MSPLRAVLSRVPPVRYAVLALLATLAAAQQAWPQFSEAPAVRLPPATVARSAAASRSSDTLVVAGGCFWGVQAVFQHVRGVQRAVSGYAGGERSTASYPTVSSGLSGHAESVSITFDPGQISVAELLRVYFSVAHNPTELNRQGPDEGSQYRSAIFYHDAQQRQVAESYISELNQGKYFHDRIVTQVVPLQAFYAAEDYHQDYATVHPESPYIARFDLPKLKNLKQLFPELYRADPVLVSAH
jgi:peptide-methionine (S)-S-oxide reductase